jgi:subtilisin family serine protease
MSAPRAVVCLLTRNRAFALFLSLFLSYAIVISLLTPFILPKAEAAPARAPKASSSSSPAPSKNSKWRDGELLVRFRQGVAEEEKNELVAAREARRIKRLKGKSRLEKLRLTPGRDPLAVAAELRQDPRVELAEPNYLVSRDETVPNDSQFVEQWALRNTGQNGGQLGSDINAPAAWDTTTGAINTVIAVVDSGIDFTHPELANNRWTKSSEQPNGVDDDSNGLIDDLHGWGIRTCWDE